MIDREQISQVLNHPVHDARGQRIGETGHIFLDDATGQPEWASIRTGMYGTEETFVPIHDAVVVEDHLEVPYPEDQVKDAPHVDVDSGGHLSAQEEERLYRHYGIDWGASGGEAERPKAAGRSGTRDRDDAMTRSEEEMHVGTERHESGRARLRKYVVTEDVQQTVPVRHEEVRIEREPITDENVDEAMRGPEISEGEYEVTLHEERPVVETEVHPVERVRMSAEERTDDEVVRGQVRKERIEADAPEGERRSGGRRSRRQDRR